MEQYEREIIKMEYVKLAYQKPLIAVYQYYAFPLAVIALYDDCLPWFYSSYINVRCNKISEGSKDFWMDFYDGNIMGGIPCLDYFIEDKTFLTKDLTAFIRYIILAIDNEKYVYTYVDVYYVPNTKAYNTHHFIHDILILGYSEEGFIVVHYDLNGNLSEFEISSIDLFNAVIHSIDKRDYIGNIITSFKRNQVVCEFDLSRIMKELQEYLYPKDLTYQVDIYFSNDNNMQYSGFETHPRLKGAIEAWKIQNQGPLSSGIGVYKEVINFYSALLANKVSYDMRPLHLLWEHKKIMLLRIGYLNRLFFDNKSLKEILIEYTEIEKTFLILRNKLIKFNVSNNLNILIDINLKIESIAEKEHKILTYLYNVLENLQFNM